MSSKEASSKTRVVLVVFALIWLVGVGVQYARFQADPAKERFVRDGVVGGEMDFVSARSGECGVFTVVLTIPMLVVLNRLAGRRNRAAAEQQVAARSTSAAAAEGWYPDPTTRHELRYWSGAAWTERVSDAGSVGEDPPDA
jgi:hypothetical protein